VADYIDKISQSGLNFDQARLDKLAGEGQGWNRWWAYQLGRFSGNVNDVTNAAGDVVHFGHHSARTNRRYWNWDPSSSWLGKLQQKMNNAGWTREGNWFGNQMYRLITKILEPINKFAYIASRYGTGEAFNRLWANMGRRAGHLWNVTLGMGKAGNAAGAGAAAAPPAAARATTEAAEKAKPGLLKSIFGSGKSGAKGGMFKGAGRWGIALGIGAVALSVLGLFKLGEKTHYDMKAHEYDETHQALGRNIKDAFHTKGSIVTGGIAAAVTAFFLRKVSVLRVLLPIAAFIGGAEIYTNTVEGVNEPKRSEKARMLRGGMYGGGMYGASPFINCYNNPNAAGYEMLMSDVTTMNPNGLDNYLANQRNLIEGHVAFQNVPFKHYIG